MIFAAKRAKAHESKVKINIIFALLPEKNAAISMANTGNFVQAEKHLKQTISLQPDFAEAHASLGAILANQNKIEEAIQHYQKALELKPDMLPAQEHLNRLLTGNRK